MFLVLLSLSLALGGCATASPTPASPSPVIPSPGQGKENMVITPTEPAVDFIIPPGAPPGANALPTPPPPPDPRISFPVATAWTQIEAAGVLTGGAKVIGQWENQAPVLNPARGAGEKVGSKAPITALAISPDKSIISFADKEEIWLCDSQTGRVLQVIYTLESPFFSGRARESLERGASSLAWSADGKKLAAGSWHGQVVLWRWDASTRRLRPGRNILQTSSRSAYFGDSVEVAFGPDSNLLAGLGSNGSITIWDSETLQVKESFYTLYAGYFSWAPGGKLLADEYLNLHKVGTGQSLPPPEKSSISGDQPQGIAWSPDGKQLAVSADGFDLGLVEAPVADPEQLGDKGPKKVAAYRKDNSSSLPHYREGRPVAWSPDSQRVGVANLPEAGKITIWDSSGQKPLVINSSPEALTSLVWPTPGVLIAAGNDGSLRYWQLPGTGE